MAKLVSLSDYKRAISQRQRPDDGSEFISGLITPEGDIELCIRYKGEEQIILLEQTGKEHPVMRWRALTFNLDTYINHILNGSPKL